MYQYLPGLRGLRGFCLEVYRLFDAEQVARLARGRRALLLKEADYRQVPELQQAMGLLEGGEFDKMIAFLGRPAPQRVRTNNHAERANRQLRFCEKARYKWRSQRSLGRFLRLRLGLLAERLGHQTPPPDRADQPPRSALEQVASHGGD
jgi:hypothetical protein